jgi:hypothetical protein
MNNIPPATIPEAEKGWWQILLHVFSDQLRGKKAANIMLGLCIVPGCYTHVCVTLRACNALAHHYLVNVSKKGMDEWIVNEGTMKLADNVTKKKKFLIVGGVTAQLFWNIALWIGIWEPIVYFAHWSTSVLGSVQDRPPKIFFWHEFILQSSHHLRILCQNS